MYAKLTSSKDKKKAPGTLSQRVAGIWSIWSLSLFGLSGWSNEIDKTDPL